MTRCSSQEVQGSGSGRGGGGQQGSRPEAAPTAQPRGHEPDQGSGGGIRKEQYGVLQRDIHRA